MFLKLDFVNTSVAIFILSIGGHCCSTGILKTGEAKCCFNNYKDGYECKACPPGYFGNNCSSLCSAPYFGLGCNQKCECYPCHHIYGCRLRNETTDYTECPSGCSEVCTPAYSGSACREKCNCTPCHLIYGCNQTLTMEETTTFEPEPDFEKTTKTPKQETKSTGRLLIILAGSVVSLALFLIIVYELYTYRHISNPIGVHHVANGVYEDIAAANVQRVLHCL